MPLEWTVTRTTTTTTTAIVRLCIVSALIERIVYFWVTYGKFANSSHLLQLVLERIHYHLYSTLLFASANCVRH